MVKIKLCQGRRVNTVDGGVENKNVRCFFVRPECRQGRRADGPVSPPPLAAVAEKPVAFVICVSQKDTLMDF